MRRHHQDLGYLYVRRYGSSIIDHLCNVFAHQRTNTLIEIVCPLLVSPVTGHRKVGLYHTRLDVGNPERSIHQVNAQSVGQYTLPPG